MRISMSPRTRIYERRNTSFIWKGDSRAEVQCFGLLADWIIGVVNVTGEKEISLIVFQIV